MTKPTEIEHSTLPESYKKAVDEAAEVIRKGGVILYPTDTIWGLGCDATNEKAVERIYSIKQRAESKAMILLVDSDAKIQGLVREVPDIAWQLIDAAISPLTIIYPGGRNVAPQLLPPEGTIGIRITQEIFSQALCKKIRVPLVSTSANISGTPSPQSFVDISEEIIHAVDYVVPVRQNEYAPQRASEIIAVGLGGEIKVLRK